MDDSKRLNLCDDLAHELGILLKARDAKLVLAESCTGGMVAQSVTSVAGSSAWFDYGLVTYSNQSKIDLLNVLNQTLNTHGAVSEYVAKEMVLGCLSRNTLGNSHNQIAGSITGIAGPDGGTIQKPVGTVCFAWAGLDVAIKAETKIFSGNRQQVRLQATAFMLQGLIERTIAATN